MKIHYAKIYFEADKGKYLARLPEGLYLISNAEELSPEQTWGLFTYEPADQFARFITEDEVKNLVKEKTGQV